MGGRGAAVAALLLAWTVAAAAQPADPPAAQAADEADEEEDDDVLRQRLTEREDQRRPLRPFTVHLFDHPLTLGGEYELQTAYVRRRVFDERVAEPDRLLLETELELEAFYTAGPLFSLFLQARLVLEEDLLGRTFEGVSDFYVERGETWVYSEGLFGTGLRLDLGRLHFEDERRWWWDEELDAVRLGWERGEFEIEVAVARELAPERSDRSFVDPEQERVLRVLADASWDFHAHHGVELFALYQDDTSPRESVGQVVRFDREDEEDGRLTWLGGRVLGAFDAGPRGIVGYWLDVAWVFGRERRADTEPISRTQVAVEDVWSGRVGGWGLDVGGAWILPVALEPRFFAAFAMGSGDASPESDHDDSFRQTGVETNEAGFGGVERFAHYGVLLDPELSNLRVFTLGVGFSLLRSSSLDLVYHYYRLVEPADELRDARLELELDGRHRDLGHAVDVVLALEEWERLEFEVIASAYRAGAAAGAQQGRWAWGGAFAVRFGF